MIGCDNMKTKIFVCSNSGIDYISHSKNISSLPVTIKFNAEEEYIDYLDAISDAYYNRVKHSKMKPTIHPIKKDRVVEMLENTINAQYKHALFILSSEEFIQIEDIVLEAAEGLNISIDIIKTNAISYPLASMTIEADKMLNKQNKRMKTVENRIRELEDNYTIYIYSTDKAAKTINGNMLFEEEIVAPAENGDIFIFNGQLSKVDKKLKLKFDDMISMFNKDIGNEDVMPFILYNTKDSLYNDLLEEELLNIFGNLRYIKKYPIPPGVGNKFGVNTCMIGFIKF